MAQGTREIHLEEHIVEYLVTHGGFHEVSASAYDKDLCLIPSEAIAFIQDTQPEKYIILKAEQYGDKVDEKIVGNIAKTYKDHKDKTLDLFRNKVKDRGVQFDMVYYQPANNKTPEHKDWYQKNRLAVVRQLKYSAKNNNSIDLVLFVNGIPVVTIELKNELTGQSHHNAIKQYIQDRDPKGEPFLEFKRCLVHFAVGTEKVFMTTELKGKGTFFLPFNQELENFNPVGFATSYLWEDVLSKDSLLDLIQNYINIQTDVEKEYDASTKALKEKKSTKLLFPRFHQRRAVQRLLQAVKDEGAGKNYLIQHSAGSGKSNTITWLAYRLAGFYQHENDEKALYDSVVIVNDRRALDKKIQNNILSPLFRRLNGSPNSYM